VTTPSKYPTARWYVGAYGQYTYRALAHLDTGEPAGSLWWGCSLMACGRRLNVLDSDPLAVKLSRGWDVELCPTCARRAQRQGLALPDVPVRPTGGDER
jgi:hypothetical protein